MHIYRYIHLHVVLEWNQKDFYCVSTRLNSYENPTRYAFKLTTDTTNQYIKLQL